MLRASTLGQPLQNEELKQFLLHEDMMVRECVAYYFFESWSDDDDLIPLVLEGCRRYGEEASFSTLQLARRFRFSTAALLDAVQELERSQPPYVESWIGRAPLSLIQSHEDLLRTVLSLGTVARIERRRVFSQMSTTELWRKLTATAHRADVQGTSPTDEELLVDLKEAIASRESRQGIAEKVRDVDQLPGYWLKVCMLELAGAMKLLEVTRTVAHQLAGEDDDLAETAATALSRMGGDGVVHYVQDHYADKPWAFRLHAIGALQAIKTGKAEATLCALLEIEEDPALRGRLFDALRFHFSEGAAKLMRDEIVDPTSWMLDEELKKALYVNAKILGRDDPQAEEWVLDDDAISSDGILFHIPVMDLGTGSLE